MNTPTVRTLPESVTLKAAVASVNGDALYSYRNQTWDDLTPEEQDDQLTLVTTAVNAVAADIARDALNGLAEECLARARRARADTDLSGEERRAIEDREGEFAARIVGYRDALYPTNDLQPVLQTTAQVNNVIGGWGLDDLHGLPGVRRLRRHRSGDRPMNAIPDPMPWVHAGGTRVADPSEGPEGGYTYLPRPGFSDYPDRYVSTRHKGAVDRDGDVIPLEALAARGYVTEDWGLWQQNACGVYAVALIDAYPGLRLGVFGDTENGGGDPSDGWRERHFFAHDDEWAYDSAGRHRLPYLGVVDPGDYYELGDCPEDRGLRVEADSERGRTLAAAALAHAHRHGIGPDESTRQEGPRP